MSGDDGSMTWSIKLRSSSSAKNLQNIQDSNINKSTLFGIINFRAFNDDSMSG